VRSPFWGAGEFLPRMVDSKLLLKIFHYISYLKAGEFPYIAKTI
jgi:hypothetical protein